MENFALFLTFLLSAIAEISAAAIVCSVLCLSSGAKSQISHSASAKTTEGIDGFIYASLESKLRFSSFVCFGVNKLLEQGNWSLLPRNALIFHLLCSAIEDFHWSWFHGRCISTEANPPWNISIVSGKSWGVNRELMDPRFESSQRIFNNFIGDCRPEVLSLPLNYCLLTKGRYLCLRSWVAPSQNLLNSLKEILEGV